MHISYYTLYLHYGTYFKYLFSLLKMFLTFIINLTPIIFFLPINNNNALASCKSLVHYTPFTSKLMDGPNTCSLEEVLAPETESGKYVQKCFIIVSSSQKWNELT